MAFFVVTFASDDAQKGLAEALRHNALNVGKADHVVIMDQHHPLIQKLRSQESPSLKFDWGYWKPYVIDFMLHNVQDNDTVAFVDPSLRFKSSFLLGNQQVLLFAQPQKMLKAFCTRDCMDAVGEAVAEAEDAPCVDSGLQIYRKTPVTMAFVKKYLETCSTAEAMDEVFRKPNDPLFQAHEHEQSVLGCLAASDKDDVVHVLPAYDEFMGKADPLSASSSRIPRVVVVTPTIGAAHLAKCIQSVQDQDLVGGVEHLIVIDGPEYVAAVDKIVEPFLLKKPIQTMVLPFNVGREGWCGHRVYASLPFLLDADYVAYLDEDNTYSPDHLSSMLHLVQSENLNWAYSLRRIVDQNGVFLANDDCESLGGVCHTVIGWQDFLVDTSCYFLSIEVARAASPHWMHRTRQQSGQEADRSVAKFLLTHPTFRGKCTNKYSLSYAVASNAATSVHGNFFLEGNKIFRYNFGENPTVYIFHFNPEQTAKFLMSMHKQDRSYALDEWQMTLLRGLTAKFNLVNGYACEPFIPSGSVVYVSMCHLHELPAKTLERSDIHRILYTIESPNIRHQQQWSLGFLTKYFDHLLTYWTPLLTSFPSTVFCPHNTHHLDLDNPLDRQILHYPKTKDKVGRDVVMVLECRDLAGDYNINGIPLQCLDGLRKHYVKSLKDITVYGIGWDRFKENPKLKVGHTKHRSLDDQSTVSILTGYTFALIIENTNADGYVSEKIYDAWMAGCIPLYYGNNNANVGISDDMYVDVKKFATSDELQGHLEKLTLKEIRAKRKFIIENREAALKRVSVQGFAEAFEKAYENTRKH